MVRFDAYLLSVSKSRQKFLFSFWKRLDEKQRVFLEPMRYCCEATWTEFQWTSCVMNADKYNLETRETLFTKTSSGLETATRAPWKSPSFEWTVKAILKWKRNCFKVLKYTSVAKGRAQIRLQFSIWLLFDRHFEKMELPCYQRYHFLG